MLEIFLNNKPLYYDEIDYSRMPRVFERVESYFRFPKIIHLIGTNGKGTTGRFLASALNSLGHSVGHYTSPHIAYFNERIWLNGANVESEILDEAHEALQKILTQEESDSLSYFEYTTLIAMKIFEEVEYVVLEAGLGGEHDATAVFPKTLTLVTPIDIDHEAFLGNTIKAIATTKLRAIDKSAILGQQVHSEVYDIAQEMATSHALDIKKVEDFLDKVDYEKINLIAENLSLAPYLRENLKLSVSALKRLGIEYGVSDFHNSKLFGRLTPLSENILLDVGHNVLAAESIYKALQGKEYILVYNSYKDKNYKEILRILKPIIKYVELISVDDQRIEKNNFLSQALDSLDIEYKYFESIKSDEKYLVFGSFKVAQEFLKIYNEK